MRSFDGADNLKLLRSRISHSSYFLFMNRRLSRVRSATHSFRAKNSERKSFTSGDVAYLPPEILSTSCSTKFQRSFHPSRDHVAHTLPCSGRHSTEMISSTLRPAKTMPIFSQLDSTAGSYGGCSLPPSRRPLWMFVASSTSRSTIDKMNQKPPLFKYSNLSHGC